MLSPAPVSSVGYQTIPGAMTSSQPEDCLPWTRSENGLTSYNVFLCLCSHAATAFIIIRSEID